MVYKIIGTIFLIGFCLFALHTPQATTDKVAEHNGWSKERAQYELTR